MSISDATKAPVTASCAGRDRRLAAEHRAGRRRSWLVLAAGFVLVAALGAPVRAQCTDNDGDGFGDPGSLDCPLGARRDCDDGDPAINPLTCSDNDCDGFGAPESDLCPNGGELDCNDSNADIFPGATEVCDCADTDCDCDDDIDEGFDGDGDGKLPCCFSNGGPQDCDDADSTVYQGAPDICDGKDNDCDGKIDQDFDADGDGFSTCFGDIDCDDNNAEINPGHDEICGNGVDDDCDGDTDEGDCVMPARPVSPTAAAMGTMEVCNGMDDDGDGFTDEGFNVGGACLAGGPDPVTGPCFEPGTRQCLPDESGTFCQPNNPPVEFADEGPAGGPLCNDGKDNDCDGDIDVMDSGCQSAEVCDGFDNDQNGQTDEGFPGLGDPCQDGIGLCLVVGTVICTADHTGTRCSVSAPPPSPEGPPDALNCFDGVDNDCDGLTDFDDGDCRGPERCDGRDNDGNGQTDETFALGVQCFAGDGACMAEGVTVCSGDEMGTACSAVASLGIPEGPDGITCFDGIDNNCDGATDLDDPMCASALMTVKCALEPGVCHNCVGWYRIRYEFEGAQPDAQVTAELIAMDANGTEVEALPVNDGDFAKLGAIRYPTECILAETVGGIHQVWAPVPLLRVTVADSLNSRQAFCTNIPWVDVIRPNGEVVVDSLGDVTHVFAAIPLIDLDTIRIFVDGVDILDLMAIDRVNDLPGGPFQDMIPIGPELVTVEDLIIDAEPLGVLSSNTVRFKLIGLGCGGHSVVIEGDPLPGALSEPQPDYCHMDDLTDLGCSIGFTIEIDTPLPGDITSEVPTPVIGEVCHGIPIQSVSINGMGLDPADQVFTPSENLCADGTYVWPIDEQLPRTNLRAISDTQVDLLGTFDQGGNRLIVDAIDSRDNRAFETYFFATTPISPIAVIESRNRSVVAGGGSCGMPPAPCCPEMDQKVKDALVIGLSQEAMQNFFRAVLDREDVQALIEQGVIDSFLAAPPDKQVVNCLPVLCDLTVTTTMTEVDTSAWADFDFAAALTLTVPDDPAMDAPDGQGLLHVNMNLPPLVVTADSKGYCCDEFCCVPTPFGCAAECCWISIDVDIQTVLTLTGENGGWTMSFDLTEPLLEGGGNAEVAIVPPTGEIMHEFPRDDISVGGVIVVLASILLAITLFVVGTIIGSFIGMPFLGGFFAIAGSMAIIIFNAVDKAELFFDNEAIADAIASNGPSIPFEALDFDFTEDISSLMLKADSMLKKIEVITDQGVNLIMDASVLPTTQDPCVVPSMGFPLSCAAAPLLPQPTVMDNAYAILSDDVVNQMMESSRVTGALPTDFTALSNIGAVLPCAGCNGFPPTPACCGSLLSCFGMGPATGLLVQAEPTTAPALMLVDDSNTPDAVEVQLRLNDVSFSVVADRNNDNALGSGATCPLPSMPVCLPSAATIPPTCTPGTADCRFYEACYDLVVNVTLSATETMVDGIRVPQITFTNVTLQGMVDTPGAVCAASTGSFGLFPADTADALLQAMIANFPNTFPPYTIGGLNLDVNSCVVGPDTNPGMALDGFGCNVDADCESDDCAPLLRINTPKLLSIESNMDDAFQDYIGLQLELVTCAGVSCPAGEVCNPDTGACQPE